MSRWRAHRKTRDSGSQAMLDKNLVSISGGNDSKSKRQKQLSIYKKLRPSLTPLFTAPDHDINTRKKMTFNHRVKGVLFFAAILALGLNSAQISVMLISNSSLSEAPGRLGLTLGTVTNQSEQNDISIHCEIGQESRFGRPRPISCADALHSIPKDTDLLFFSKRGTAPRGAKGLPYRYISRKT